MKMETKQLALDAMLAAMCAVLSFLSLSLGNLKFTFEGLPVLIGALLFGAVDGAMIGGVGTLIGQLLRYGFTATTVLWILPYVLCGLVTGLYAQRKRFCYKRQSLIVVLVLVHLMVTGVNSISILVDSKIYGWYYPTIITGAIATRLLVSLIKGIAFGAILPELITILRRQAHISAS